MSHIPPYIKHLMHFPLKPYKARFSSSASMAASSAPELLHLNCFTHQIFNPAMVAATTLPPPTRTPLQQIQEIITKDHTTPPSISTSFTSEPRSPTSVLSDQSFKPENEHKHGPEPPVTRRTSTVQRKQRRTRRNVVGGKKSLLDLENEELKGFMDLGFVFDEDYKESRLMTIVPGLRRHGNGDDNESIRRDVPRPYLSEAWDEMEKRDDLTNWRYWDLSDDNKMKNRIKVWAHCVAASVR
ncbi:hypothetical protein Drorol1_Dr00019264 [Drosera rotundifolia]